MHFVRLFGRRRADRSSIRGLLESGWASREQLHHEGCAEARRQSAAVGASTHGPEDQDFIDAISDRAD
jgi:hypothetical protein